MGGEILDLIGTEYVFFGLFAYLLIYILNQNQVREQNYQKIIQEFNEVISKMKVDLEDIKEEILNKCTK